MMAIPRRRIADGLAGSVLVDRSFVFP